MIDAPLPSLRGRLLRHVLLPLVAFWLVASTVAVTVGSYFVERVFDRALLDDAYGLSASVNAGADGDGLHVDLSLHELKAVLFDQSESVHFVVRLPDGRVVAGEPRLPVPVLASTDAYDYDDVALDGVPLRAVVLRKTGPQPFELVLAQTTGNRRALLRDLLLASAVPLVLLLVALGVWLRRAIDRDLAPVAALQATLDRRDAADLRPLAVPAGTADVDRLARSIDGLMARLEGALRNQREFAGNVAHELRTPLAGLRAQAEFGLASADAAAWREQLRGVLQSATRASHLIDQLLALAVADEAHDPARLRDVTLDELVRRVVLRAMPRADAEGIDLGADGLDEPCAVRGDEGLIEGALQNLLDNALRYGRSPDQPSQVTVAIEHGAGGAVALSVVDNGPGIGATDSGRLLERWQQGRAGRRLGSGAGLGLSIVSRYASLLGARLEVGPRPQGRGARVALVFDTAADRTPRADEVNGGPRQAVQAASPLS